MLDQFEFKSLSDQFVFTSQREKMNFPIKRKLDVGNIDTLFDEEEIQHLKEIESFKVDDSYDELLNRTYDNVKNQVEKNKMGSAEKKLDGYVQMLDNNNSEFLEALSKRTKKYNKLPEVRNKCKLHAEKFRFSINLFNRTPMWVFRCFTADDPLCKINYMETKKIDFMTVFMLINKISPNLMMACYLEGGQSVNDVIDLHKYFILMEKLYEEGVIGMLDDSFAFHLESRTLRRLDMSIVESGPNQSKQNEPFLPHNTNWRRQRVLRNLIRMGQYKIRDEYDLLEVKEAYQQGLRLKGRFMNRN